MTSKEELQKHIQLLNEIKSRYPILTDTIKYLEEYQQTLSHSTLSECIKEWEDRGYAFIKHNDSIEFRNNEKEELFFFDLEEKAYAKTDTTNLGLVLLITNEEHNLINKTLKALEAEK